MSEGKKEEIKGSTAGAVSAGTGSGVAQQRLTEKQMHAIAKRLTEIEYVKKVREGHRAELAFVNKNAKVGKVYRVFVKLKGEQYYNEKTDVSIDLDSGIVQQHFINAISACNRQIIQLGGEP